MEGTGSTMLLLCTLCVTLFIIGSTSPIRWYVTDNPMILLVCGHQSHVTTKLQEGCILHEYTTLNWWVLCCSVFVDGFCVGSLVAQAGVIGVKFSGLNYLIPMPVPSPLDPYSLLLPLCVSSLGASVDLFS